MIDAITLCPRASNLIAHDFGERSRMATHGIVARVFETDDSCCLIRKASELYPVADKEAE